MELNADDLEDFGVTNSSFATRAVTTKNERFRDRRQTALPETYGAGELDNKFCKTTQSDVFNGSFEQYQ